ncbi:MAG: hemolysin family protein [Acidobacteriota bacterium]
MTLLLVYVGLAVGVSFLCSLLEATLLSSRDLELTERAQRGEKGAITLLDLKKHRIDDAISSILILNTIAHTMGTVLAGTQAAKLWPGEVASIVFSVLMTILVLYGSEIVPKTLGTVFASRLVSFVGPAIKFLVWLLTPLLYTTRALTRLIARGEKKPVSRREVAALVDLAAKEGTLEAQESTLMSNVLGLETITVEDVMTPRTVIFMQPESATVQDFLDTDDAGAFSRIPLYGETPDHVTQYVLHREILWQVSRGIDRETPLTAFARPVWAIPETQTLGRALRQFIEKREHLAICLDEYGGVAGLVTLEDLMETVLGVEILDESDRHADLQQLAKDLRDRRLRRRQESASSSASKADGPATEGTDSGA